MQFTMAQTFVAYSVDSSNVWDKRRIRQYVTNAPWMAAPLQYWIMTPIRMAMVLRFSMYKLSRNTEH
jgi:hypothetical protein